MMNSDSTHSVLPHESLVTDFSQGGQNKSVQACRSDFLISDPRVRAERAAEKRGLVLRFLRDEIWTSTDVVATLLDIRYPAAHALLKSMKRAGFVASAEVYIPGPRGSVRCVLYGVTAHGLAYAWDLDEIAEARTPWEASKTNALFVPHQIATQKARIKAERCGWKNWLPARSLMKQGLPKLPDGEATSPSGDRVAIEVEREIKTDKRYEAVLGAYVYQIKLDQRWCRVDYLCPDDGFARRLARSFGRLSQLRLEGRGDQSSRTGQLTQAHLDRFRIYNMSEWPEGPFITPEKTGAI